MQKLYTWQLKKYNNTYTCEYINIYIWSLQSVLNNIVQSLIFFSQNIYIYIFAIYAKLTRKLIARIWDGRRPSKF